MRAPITSPTLFRTTALTAAIFAALLSGSAAAAFPFEKALGLEKDESAGTSETPRGTAPGATAASVLRPSAHAPLGASTPLFVSLDPDETACRAAWGDEWFQKCLRTLGRQGARAEGIRMTPALPGIWRTDGPSLVFTPEKPWQSNERIVIDLTDFRLPEGVRLTTPQITVRTPPLALLRSEARLRIDPNPKGGRFVTLSGELSTAPDRRLFERNLRLTATDPTLRLGAPQFLWEEADPAAFYVKIPVLTLSDRPATLTAEWRNVAERVETDRKGVWFVPKGLEKARFTVSVPGESTLFQVTGATLRTARGEDLSDEYEVTVTTSVNVPTKDLLKALEIRLLPERMREGAVSPTDWSRAPRIDDEVLGRSATLPFRAAERTGGAVTEHRIRFAAPSGRHAALTLPRGFAAPGTKGLTSDWRMALALPDPGKRIDFLQPGHLLTFTGAERLSFAATGLSEVEYRIARVRDELLAIRSDGWGALTRPSSEDALEESQSGRIPLPPEDGRARFGSVELGRILSEKGPGLYQVTLTGYVEKAGERRAVATAQKRLLISDTGLIVKENADATIDVFALNLSDHQPASNRTALLLAANGTVLESVPTDAAGRARFASVRGLEREKRPVAVLLKGNAAGSTLLGWISLTDGENRSNLTRFDTGGRMQDENLGALAFAERGVYRPGETVHWGAVVSTTDRTALPKDLPVTLALTDTAGRTLFQKTQCLPSDGLAALDWRIPEGFAAGRLRCDVRIGKDRILSTAEVLVEDFAPETLRLDFAPSRPARGWLHPKDLTLAAELTHLAGSAAEGRTVSGTVYLRGAGEIRFPEYAGFAFLDPLPEPVAAYRNLPVAERPTDASGRAELRMPTSELAPATYRAGVTLEGRELEGGRAVTTSETLLLSTAPEMLGWRLADTPQGRDALTQGSKATVETVLVDANLVPQAGRQLRALFAERRSVTELATDATGRVETRRSFVTTPIGEAALTTDTSGRARTPLPTDRSGELLVTFETESGVPLGRLPYRVAATDLEAATGELRPVELKLTPERTSVRTGETLPITLLSPYDGTLLLTLEGRSVADARWIPVKTGLNRIDWKVPAGDAVGKHYLHAAVVKRLSKDLKPGASDTALLKGYAETVVPLSLNRRDRTAEVRIDVPAASESPEAVPVTISSDRPVRVFVWAVDEGVLALTGYRTPDPARAMFDDRALGVATRQILEHQMPEAPKGVTASGYGGGFESARAMDAMTNPFRRHGVETALWWGGLVEAGPQPKTLTMRLPESFDGAVRIMAVGAGAAEGNAAHLASAAKDARIARPLRIEPVLPVAVTVGDRFRAAALVTKSDDRGEARVRLSAPGFATENPEVNLRFEGKGTRPTGWNLTAPDIPGNVALEMTATADPLRTRARTTIAVRPAGLFNRETTGGPWREGAYGWSRVSGVSGQGEIALSGLLLPLEAETSLTLSTLPLPLLSGFLAASRPQDWGTVRERIDEAWPLLLLPEELKRAVLGGAPDAKNKTHTDKTDLADRADQADETAERLARALAEINAELTSRGLPPWRWGDPDTRLTAEALLFLLDARVTDPSVDGLILRVRRSLEANLNRTPATLSEARDAAFALRVLTREGTLVADRLEALRRTVAERFEGAPGDALHVYLAAAARTMRMARTADALLPAGFALRADTPLSDTASALSAHIETGGRKDLSEEFRARLVRDATRALSEGTLGAREAALATRALMDAGLFEGKTAPAIASCARWAEGFTPTQILSETPYGIRLSAPGCTHFSVRSPELGNLYWSVERAGFPRDAEAGPVREGMEVSRRYLNRKGEEATEFALGELVTVEIRLRAYGQSGRNRNLTRVALTDLVPGGFTLADAPGTPAASPTGHRVLDTLRREDRMGLLIESVGSDEAVFTYTLRATAEGTFRTAPADARSLDDRTAHARGTGGSVTVR